MKTRLTRWILAVALVGAFAACTGAAGADKGPLQQADKAADARKGGGEDKGPLDQAAKVAEAKKVEPLVIRMYNVQDLMMGRDSRYSGPLPPTHPDAGGSGVQYYAAEAASVAGGGAGLFGSAQAVGDQAAISSTLSPEVVEEVIHRTINSEGWEDEGGRAKIIRVGALLVVTQTAENQKKIAELLEQFRAQRQMVAIEARWVLLDDAQVAQLVPEGAKRTVPLEIPPAVLAAADAKVIYRGQITCFDRQRVHLVTGKAQVYVADATPVVAESAVGWDAQINSILMGAMVEIVPALSPDGKAVTLDLQSHVSEAGGENRKATLNSAIGGKDQNGNTAKAEIELPEFLLQTFSTSIRMPLGKPVLIGGMTSPMAANGKVVYLILEVSASK
ncbi:MAG: hypothetical protein NTY65_15705 [Planctomycetota bacterium]|nr:hypothetical protein [Planctomycetota bacterium]